MPQTINDWLKGSHTVVIVEESRRAPYEGDDRLRERLWRSLRACDAYDHLVDFLDIFISSEGVHSEQNIQRFGD